MISPPFDILEDSRAAEVYSELLRLGEFKFASKQDYIELDEEPRFNLSNIVCICAAYLETASPKGIKRGFAYLGSNIPPQNEIDQLYFRSITERQHRMKDLLKVTSPVPGLQNQTEIQHFCMEAIRNKKRLLAAHLIGLSSSGLLIDTLAIPAEVARDIPLMIRNSLIPAIAKYGVSNSMRNELQPLLRIEGKSRETGLIASASFLSPKFDENS